MISLELSGNAESVCSISAPRAYYIYETQAGVERGFHAHKNLLQLCTCVSGSCDFVLDNGRSRKTVRLNSPGKGLLLGNNIWREMKNFSSDCVLLVLASNHYDETDYIRDYTVFKDMRK